MGGSDLPEELLIRIMRYLRSSIGPTGGLWYDWTPTRYYESVGSENSVDFLPDGPYADRLLVKPLHDERISSTRTLLSCMRASQLFRRLAQAVYYETVYTDRLLPFVQRCINQPDLAGHVRELYISDEMVMGNRGFVPVELLSDINKAAGHDSFRSRVLTHGMSYDWSGRRAIPVALVAVVLCTKLERIVVKENARVDRIFPESPLTDCAAHSRTNDSTASRVPLSNLRGVAIQARNQSDKGQGPEMDSTTWVESLARLPKIESIEVSAECYGVDICWPDADGSWISNLRSLTIASFRSQRVADTIRCILTICPILECLDLTTSPGLSDDPEPSTWSEIGEVLNRQGPCLRKLRFDNVRHGWDPGLLDVSSLRNLRYLAVTVDALVELHECEIQGFRDESVVNGNRHGCGSVHNIEDMWSETITNAIDEARRHGSVTASYHEDARDVTRSLLGDSPDVTLSRLLPDTLQRIRIMNDIDTERVGRHVDERLRDLILDPRFSDLCDVQVRRRKLFFGHVKDLGWRVERRPFWNVMTRI